MKMIINIPDYRYEQCQKDITTLDLFEELVVAVKNGTPLPKGHGRLIDADALIDTLGCSDRDIYCKQTIEEDAHTIIEADKEMKND